MSALAKIAGNKSLSENEMMDAMRTLMDGLANDESIYTFLKDMSARGETIAEITGAARVLREKARTLRAPADAVDCCGTGGDNHGTYNISTAVALVSAACGVPIAKHGNRAASSKSGTADVLEALGVNLNVPQVAQEEALIKFNFAFLMAPLHHEAVRHASTARKKLGTRTIFNLIGPLANPAETKMQLLGVFDRKWILPMAEALKNLGSQKAWIVCGSDGLDEITLAGPTYAAMLENGKVTEKTLIPADFGLPIHETSALKGGSAQDNAHALSNLLKGQKSAYRDVVLANAAAVLNIHGSASNLKDGVAKAAAAIDDRHALHVLENYVEFSKGFLDERS